MVTETEMICWKTFSQDLESSQKQLLTVTNELLMSPDNGLVSYWSCWILVQHLTPQISGRSLKPSLATSGLTDQLCVHSLAELPTLTVSPCDARFCMFSHALTPHIKFLTPKKNQILCRDAFVPFQTPRR